MTVSILHAFDKII